MWFQFRLVLKSKGPICLVDSSLDISVNVICGGAQAVGEERPWPSVDGIWPFLRVRRCLSLPGVPNSLKCLGVHSENWPTLAGMMVEEERECGILFPVSLSELCKGSLPLQAVCTLLFQ